MSQITNYSNNIDTAFPVQGTDNPSAGFRDNFTAIKLSLDNAASEITALQTNPNQSLITLGDGLTINTYTGATTLVPASPTAIGGVLIGSGIAIDSSGTISVALVEPATTSTLGGVKIGSGVTVDSLGTISVEVFTLTTATTSTLGGIVVGTGLYVDNSGTLNVSPLASLPVASTTTQGIVKIGPGILVSTSGTISVPLYSLPIATTATIGGIKVYGGGALSLQPDGVLGFAVVYSNGTGTQFVNVWPNDGVTPPKITYNLLPATTSTLGGVVLDAGVISKTTLKSLVAAANSWTDFQSAIALL
jgi:hypothetical protein